MWAIEPVRLGCGYGRPTDPRARRKPVSVSRDAADRRAGAEPARNTLSFSEVVIDPHLVPGPLRSDTARATVLAYDYEGPPVEVAGVSHEVVGGIRWVRSPAAQVPHGGALAAEVHDLNGIVERHFAHSFHGPALPGPCSKA
jgi:hypothetical protein